MQNRVRSAAGREVIKRLGQVSCRLKQLQLWLHLAFKRQDNDEAVMDERLRTLCSASSDWRENRGSRQRERDFEQAEESHRTYFEKSALGMFERTPTGRLIRVNLALAMMLGAESPEGYINQFDDIRRRLTVDPVQWIELEDRMRRDGRVVSFEYQTYRCDGSKIWVSENSRAVLGLNGEIAYHEGTLQDISENKRTEEQLRHSEELVAVGRIASNVAHDLNNVLMIVNGYSELMLDVVGAESSLMEMVCGINQAGMRGMSMTRRLLDLGQQELVESSVLNMNGLIEETRDMLRQLIREDIELVFSPDPCLGKIRADPTQIVRIVMNLVVNARDAMPHGGKLIIETRNAPLDDAYLATHPGIPPGDYIRLKVSDTGSGMDSETLSRIFEPFFTTKGAAHGTGLGLPIIQEIVEQNEGHISVCSRPQEGSTFSVYLPRVYGILQAAFR